MGSTNANGAKPKTMTDSKTRAKANKLYKSGKTQTEIANTMGVTQSVVSSWLAGCNKI